MNTGNAYQILAILAILATVAYGETDVSMQEPVTIIDFSTADTSSWSRINDGVMGGVSRSDIRRTDRGTGLFSGVLSLENNGGFASVRTSIGSVDLEGRDGLEARVLGDGRTYQLRLRTDDRFDGVAYRAEFATEAGEWIVVRIPFAAFEPTYRGRILRDRGPLDPSRIRQLGFMLADKTPGPFSLEIDRVLAWTATPETTR
jgi:monofunctional biosynthetic peptidoglycan transglycosylase